MAYNYETQAYLAYARAVDFAKAVDIMEHSSAHLMIPQIVNAAFSCELMLKATIIMEKEKQVDFISHRFDELFSKLTPGTQKRLGQVLQFSTGIGLCMYRVMPLLNGDICMKMMG